MASGYHNGNHPLPLFSSFPIQLWLIGPAFRPLSCQGLCSPCLLTGSHFGLPKPHSQWVQLFPQLQFNCWVAVEKKRKPSMSQICTAVHLWLPKPSHQCGCNPIVFPLSNLSPIFHIKHLRYSLICICTWWHTCIMTRARKKAMSIVEGSIK